MQLNIRGWAKDGESPVWEVSIPWEAAWGFQHPPGAQASPWEFQLPLRVPASPRFPASPWGSHNPSGFPAFPLRLLLADCCSNCSSLIVLSCQWARAGLSLGKLLVGRAGRCTTAPSLAPHPSGSSLPISWELSGIPGWPCPGIWAPSMVRSGTQRDFSKVASTLPVRGAKAGGGIRGGLVAQPREGG